MAEDYICSPWPEKSDAYVVLHIPAKTDEEKLKVAAAEEILHGAGVNFDVGETTEGVDWFFDWSLSGAVILLSLAQPKMIPPDKMEALIQRVKGAALEDDKEAQKWLKDRGIKWN
jgi:hypothetical protein